MTFNPFKKQIGARLTADDLQELLGMVAEGYYVEYKETFPKSAKIEHTIASLANTYGGWYLVGIKTDANHVASEICGFRKEDFPDPVATVRDVAKTRIDPVPILYPATIPISETHSALAVFVPPDQNTPFVTNDGRVYRRNHDSSDPVPEDRRHTLDNLYNAGERTRRRFRDFCKAEIEPARVGEDNLAWFNLFLQPTPLGLTYDPELLSKQSIDRLLELSRVPQKIVWGDDWSITGSLPFEHAQRTHNSVKLRHSRYSLTAPSIQIELFQGGSARFHVPIMLSSVLSFLDAKEFQTIAKRHLDAVLERSPGQGDAIYLTCFDVSQFLVQVVLLLDFYRAWIGKRDTFPDYHIAFSLHGLSSTVAFVDIDEWSEAVDKWGLPVLTSPIRVPDDWNDPVMIPNDNSIEDLPVSIIQMVAQSFGFTEEVFGRSLTQALIRAGKTQKASAPVV